MKRLLALFTVMLLFVAACGGTPPPDIDATVQTAIAATLTAQPTDTPIHEPTATSEPTAVSTSEPATPPPEATATSTTPPAVPPETAAEDWGEICQLSPTEEGQLVANLGVGSTVELRGYLYVKSFSNIRDGMMPFTLREIPYDTDNPNWTEACEIHLFIAIGSGPNHVTELPEKFEFGDVVVWDRTGREIRGWQRNLDSYHVRVVGVVIEAYGGDTGLGGSNTIRLQEIELLES
jgi:hypothetical protein